MLEINTSFYYFNLFMQPFFAKKNNDYQSYFHEQGIIIQFILTTYLEIARHVEQIPDESTDLNRLSNLFKRLYQQINGNASYFFIPERGLLQKLESYLFKLSETMEIKKGILTGLQKLLQNMMKVCHRAREAILKAKKNTSRLLLKIDSMHKRLQAQCIKFSAEFLPLLHRFSRDENVIWFLLKNRSQIELYLGKEYLQDYLLTNFPAGGKEVKSFLLRQYSLRGFEELQPDIIHTVHELEI